MELKRAIAFAAIFAANSAYASYGGVFARQWQTPAARGTSELTVARQALLARLASLEGEVVGDLTAASEVHLVGCLAFKRAVGDSLVVLSHVELDEPPDGREVVERVQEQPTML